MATATPVPSEIEASPALLADLQAAVRSTRQLFAAAACSCALVTEAGDALVFMAADGEGAAAIVGVSIPVSTGVAGWAAMTGQPIAVRDVQTDARFARDVAESTRYVPDRILAVPVMSPDGEVSGVMEVLDPAGDDVGSAIGEQRGTAADLDVLALVASQVAAVVRSSRALAALEDSTSSTGTLGSGSGGAPELLAAVRAVARTGPEGARLATRLLTAVTEYADGRSSR